MPASSTWPLKRRLELYLVHWVLWNYTSLKKTAPASVFFQADCQREEGGREGGETLQGCFKAWRQTVALTAREAVGGAAPRGLPRALAG